MSERKVEILHTANLTPTALLAAVLNDTPEEIEGVCIVRIMKSGTVNSMWSSMGPETVAFCGALLQRDALAKAGGHLK